MSKFESQFIDILPGFDAFIYLNLSIFQYKFQILFEIDRF